MVHHHQHNLSSLQSTRCCSLSVSVQMYLEQDRLDHILSLLESSISSMEKVLQASPCIVSPVQAQPALRGTNGGTIVNIIQTSYLAQLYLLHQTSTVDEFQQQFDAIWTHVSLEQPELPEDFFTSLFMNGLCTDVRTYVQGFHPCTVIDAYAVACIYEYSRRVVQTSTISSDAEHEHIIPAVPSIILPASLSIFAAPLTQGFVCSNGNNAGVISCRELPSPHPGYHVNIVLDNGADVNPSIIVSLVDNSSLDIGMATSTQYRHCFHRASMPKPIGSLILPSITATRLFAPMAVLTATRFIVVLQDVYIGQFSTPLVLSDVKDKIGSYPIVTNLVLSILQPQLAEHDKVRDKGGTAIVNGPSFTTAMAFNVLPHTSGHHQSSTQAGTTPLDTGGTSLYNADGSFGGALPVIQGHYCLPCFAKAPTIAAISKAYLPTRVHDFAASSVHTNVAQDAELLQIVVDSIYNGDVYPQTFNPLQLMSNACHKHTTSTVLTAMRISVFLLTASWWCDVDVIVELSVAWALPSRSSCSFSLNECTICFDLGIVYSSRFYTWICTSPLQAESVKFHVTFCCLGSFGWPPDDRAFSHKAPSNTFSKGTRADLSICTDTASASRTPKMSFGVLKFTSIVNQLRLPYTVDKTLFAETIFYSQRAISSDIMRVFFGLVSSCWRFKTIHVPESLCLLNGLSRGHSCFRLYIVRSIVPLSRRLATQVLMSFIEPPLPGAPIHSTSGYFLEGNVLHLTPFFVYALHCVPVHSFFQENSSHFSSAMVPLWHVVCLGDLVYVAFQMGTELLFPVAVKAVSVITAVVVAVCAILSMPASLLLLTSGVPIDVKAYLCDTKIQHSLLYSLWVDTTRTRVAFLWHIFGLAHLSMLSSIFVMVAFSLEGPAITKSAQEGVPEAIFSTQIWCPQITSSITCELQSFKDLLGSIATTVSFTATVLVHVTTILAVVQHKTNAQQQQWYEPSIEDTIESVVTIHKPCALCVSTSMSSLCLGLSCGLPSTLGSCFVLAASSSHLCHTNSVAVTENSLRDVAYDQLEHRYHEPIRSTYSTSLWLLAVMILHVLSELMCVIAPSV